MHKTFKFTLVLRTDTRRLAYTAIVDGLIYLIVFNTLLPRVDALYFGFLLLVFIMSVPYLFTFTASARSEALAETRGVVSSSAVVPYAPALTGRVVDVDANPYARGYSHGS